MNDLCDECSKPEHDVCSMNPDCKCCRNTIDNMGNLTLGKHTSDSSNVEKQKLHNQCDGCAAGKPLNKYGNHIMGPTAGDIMGCTKDKYK